MLGVPKELNFKFYSILVNLSGHMWLVATVLDSAALNYVRVKLGHQGACLDHITWAFINCSLMVFL